MQSRVITTGPLQIKHQLLIKVLFFILALFADALYILHDTLVDNNELPIL